MNFNQFLEAIHLIKSTKLGSSDAHFKLAPELRLKYDKDKINASNPKKLLFWHSFILIKIMKLVFY